MNFSSLISAWSDDASVTIGTVIFVCVGMLVRTHTQKNACARCTRIRDDSWCVGLMVRAHNN